MKATCAMVSILWMALSGFASGESYLIKETTKKGSHFRIEISMSLEGQIQFRQEGKLQSVPLKAKANHDLTERALDLSPNGFISRTARRYAQAEAIVTAGAHRSKRVFHKDHSLIVAQRTDEKSTVWCPTGPLQRSEVELAQHLDTLVLAGLLPQKKVKIGDSWKISSPVVGSLCHLDGVVQQSLTARLKNVESEKAIVSITGKATGLELGSLVKMEITAECHFDLKERMVTRLLWNQKDEREQGPVSPSMTTTLTSDLQRKKTDPRRDLSGSALRLVPNDLKIPNRSARLHFQGNGYHFLYNREWHVVAESKSQVVMRMLDKGDFIAQMSLSVEDDVEEKEPSFDGFQKATTLFPGWKMVEQIQAGAIPGGHGFPIYQLSARGALDGEEVIRHYYLIAGKKRHLFLVFTLSPKKAERFGSQDLAIVGNIAFKQ